MEANVEGGDDEEAGDEEEKGPEFEAKGTGVNKFTYFVASNSLSEWKKLPDLSPAEIEASRQIKVSFTGELERNIYTNPFFFGQEKHYLRAQIARISHSTTLAPNGMWRLVEDEPREIEENTPEEGDLVAPTTQAMANPANWVHYSVGVLKNCRTTHLDPVEPEEAEDWDEEVAKKAIVDADPFDSRLKPIVNDEKVRLSASVKQDAWVVRLMGDPTEYASAADPKKTESNGVVVVRSLLWPGSYSFYYRGEVRQVYVGYGHKHEQAASYFPLNPPPVLSDPAEYEDGPEPTPLEEPVAEAEAQDGEEGNEEENEEDIEDN